MKSIVKIPASKRYQLRCAAVFISAGYPIASSFAGVAAVNYTTLAIWGLAIFIFLGTRSTEEPS